MKLLAIAALGAAALSSPAAFAQEWYMGFGAGEGKIDGYPLPIESSSGNLTSSSFSPIEGREMMLTARVGLRLHRNIALEAGYFRLGDYDFQTSTISGASTLFTGTVRARSYGMSLVGIFPIAQFDLYARAGYARTELDGDAAQGDTVARAKQRFNEGFYGAGAHWNLTQQMGLFAEYQRHDKLELDGYFVGLDYRF